MPTSEYHKDCVITAWWRILYEKKKQKCYKVYIVGYMEKQYSLVHKLNGIFSLTKHFIFDIYTYMYYT